MRRVALRWRAGRLARCGQASQVRNDDPESDQGGAPPLRAKQPLGRAHRSFIAGLPSRHLNISRLGPVSRTGQGEKRTFGRWVGRWVDLQRATQTLAGRPHTVPRHCKYARNATVCQAGSHRQLAWQTHREHTPQVWVASSIR